MDGVSGVLTVVSFSVQLVNAIQKANEFLKEIQNAPRELARLVDALDQFESLLIAADGVVEQQMEMGNLSGSAHTIDAALRRCKSTVEKLDTSVNAIKNFFKIQGRGRKAWASLKTVVKKEEVEQLHKQVHGNMRDLQTALLLNMSHLQ